jgi:hypothetical protein
MNDTSVNVSCDNIGESYEHHVRRNSNSATDPWNEAYPSREHFCSCHINTSPHPTRWSNRYAYSWISREVSTVPVVGVRVLLFD